MDGFNVLSARFITSRYRLSRFATLGSIEPCQVGDARTSHLLKAGSLARFGKYALVLLPDHWLSALSAQSLNDGGDVNLAVDRVNAKAITHMKLDP